MKFKFCGDLDTPDWVLAKILLISKLSTNDLKIISNEVINDILKGEMDFDKISKHLHVYKFKDTDCKGIIAALTFIFKSSSKYICDQDVLSNELQQLGLHKEGSLIISRIHQMKMKDLRNKFENNIFRVNKLINVEWNLKTDLISSINCDIPIIELNLELEQNDKKERKNILLTVDKLLVLSEELKKMRKQIQDIKDEL